VTSIGRERPALNKKCHYSRKCFLQKLQGGWFTNSRTRGRSGMEPSVEGLQTNEHKKNLRLFVEYGFLYRKAIEVVGNQAERSTNESWRRNPNQEGFNYGREGEGVSGWHCLPLFALIEFDSKGDETQLLLI